jgi:sulfatase modifying factor 1
VSGLQSVARARPPATAPRLVAALDAYLGSSRVAPLQAILGRDFLEQSEDRYQRHVAPLMMRVPGARFLMGTPEGHSAHYCGECPCHAVELAPFLMSRVPVTHALFSLFDASRRDAAEAAPDEPVVNVTWVEAMLFALWVGCRLPTEAQWEFSCAAGAAGDWCCENELELRHHAWFSDSSNGVVQRVGRLEPNAFGLFDLHGNVWEWCADTYDEDYYARSGPVEPLNLDVAPRQHGVVVPAKVTRGGSMCALAEMCRTRYRQYEPADYWAADLGFRLARRA